MTKPFDIFWFGENGPNWIEAVETLETARVHIANLPQGTSGSYAVLDQRTGVRISFNSQLHASGARARQNLRPDAKPH